MGASSLAVGAVLFLLLLSVYSTFSARFGDLGPRGEKRTEGERSCDKVKKIFSWIKCDANNKFTPLQCNPNTGRCFCIDADSGKRVNSKTTTMKMADSNICSTSSTCPPLNCTKLCKKYQKDPDTGCKTCNCNDSVNICLEADQVVHEQWCPRDCLNKTVNDSMHCVQCMPGCVGGLGDDECDRFGNKSDTCGGNGTCVAIGRFAARKCLQPSLLDGEECKLPPPPKKKLHDGLHKKLMKYLQKIKSYEISSMFKPAKAICQKGSVCFPVNGTKSGLCRSKSEIGGPCFNNSRKLKCDFMGRFYPLQCFKNHSECWCVDPINGTEINNTRTYMEKHSKPPKCTDKVYKKCNSSFRHFQYKVDHDHYGVDPSSCRKCICENGQFNQSTCDHSHNCTLITSNSNSNCDMDGKQYKHQQVFPVDKCNKCKCLGGKISGCTRRRCKGGEDTPCDKCKKLHRKPVCGPNGVTYDNICAAVYCAGFDPVEVTPGPCSIQSPCDDAPCERGLICIPKRKVCGLRRGCQPEQYRLCVNKTELACPVAVSDEYKICGNDNRTYESLCRMILETDGVDVLFDGPCDRNDCQSTVCGTDGVTYPNKCILRSTSPNVRIDYPGTCLESLLDETVDSFCERVKKSQHCKIPTKCKHMINPTDGCCPICGAAVSLAIDEDGLAQLAEVATYEITRDVLLEAVLTNVITSNKSMNLLDKCEIEGYVASTGNLEIIFKVENTSHESECSAGAENLSNSVNNQGVESSNTVTAAPIVSFLTAGSVLEEEVGPEEADPKQAENEAKSLLPPFIHVLAIIAAIVTMI